MMTTNSPLDPITRLDKIVHIKITAQIKKLPRGPPPLHILKRRSQDSKGKGEGGKNERYNDRY